MYKIIIKPFLDFIFAVVGLIILLPVFCVIYIYLLFANDGKAIFLQDRPGKNEKIFSVIKFKTMNDKRTIEGDLLPDSQRLSGFGKFIRSTSLDEIPQLFNVIMGDMSIVGPRPLLPEYIPLYNEFQKQRHDVKPGITGYAQVNGRNAISWKKKFELDIYYVKNCSFVLDFSILLKTIKKVFVREGITNAESSTMDRFKGTSNQ